MKTDKKRMMMLKMVKLTNNFICSDLYDTLCEVDMEPEVWFQNKTDEYVDDETSEIFIKIGQLMFRFFVFHSDLEDVVVELRNTDTKEEETFSFRFKALDDYTLESIVFNQIDNLFEKN